jgi:hypothetical protein
MTKSNNDTRTDRNIQPLTEAELDCAVGGACTTGSFRTVGLGMRKSAGNAASGVMN